MACETAAPDGENRIPRFTRPFAATGFVASNDLWRSVAAFGIGGKLGIMTCRA
jgi:hypothetical protein